MSSTVDFMGQVEGDQNRRLAVITILYYRRRMYPDRPEVSLTEIEQRMGFPRDYLDLTARYLTKKKYITRADNAEFTLTVDGVELHRDPARDGAPAGATTPLRQPASASTATPPTVCQPRLRPQAWGRLGRPGRGIRRLAALAKGAIQPSFSAVLALACATRISPVCWMRHSSCCPARRRNAEPAPRNQRPGTLYHPICRIRSRDDLAMAVHPLRPAF